MTRMTGREGGFLFLLAGYLFLLAIETYHSLESAPFITFFLLHPPQIPAFGDFTKEQQDFMKEHGGNMEVGEPPWLGSENEAELREKVIGLSQDKRNFVRNPPSGLAFEFDMATSLPIALAILKEDQNLNKMRFEIVPKL